MSFVPLGRRIGLPTVAIGGVDGLMLFGPASTSLTSATLQVGLNPVVLKVYGLANGQTVAVMNVCQSQGVSAPATNTGVPIVLSAANAEVVLYLTGAYQLVATGTLGQLVVTATALDNPWQAMEAPASAPQSVVALPNPLLNGQNLVSATVEVGQLPWVFRAYGLSAGVTIAVLNVFNQNGASTVAPFTRLGAAVVLSQSVGEVVLDVAGVYQFQLSELSEGVLLVGNDTAILYSNPYDAASADKAAAAAAASAAAAATSATVATTEAGAAATSATNAASSATAAGTAAGAAATSATNAAASATTAGAAATTAATQAGIATTQATNAAASAATASTAATTATTQAGIATTQATNAAASAATASTAATTATTQAGIATTQATNAAASATTAGTAATTATTQAGIATTQAGIATTQATNATTQAGNAASSASGAASSASAASSSASTASTAATSASTSASSASTSATNAATSATNAAASAASSKAITTTTANFTQPAVNATVSVSVANTAWMSVGQGIYVSTGGYYSVISITSGLAVVLTNLGAMGNASPAATINSGSSVGAGGVPGVNGNSLNRPSTTLTPSAGVATINVTTGVEVYILTLAANVTSWVFNSLPAAGTVAEIRIEVIQAVGGTQYTCASPATAGNTAGGAWINSSAAGAIESIGLAIDSSGTVAVFPSGVYA